MKLRILTTCVVFLLGTCTQGAIIVEDVNLAWGPGVISGEPGVPWANYVARVYQDAAASDYTDAWFYYSGTTIRGVNANLDEGSDWYVVEPGQILSATTIQQGLFAPLITFDSLIHFYPPVAVGGVQNIYLGVATQYGLTTSRNVYGWVHLRRDQFAPTLTMVDNVLSYGSRGIVVGTTTVVPEPAGPALTICAIGVLGSCRSLPRKGRRFGHHGAAVRA